MDYSSVFSHLNITIGVLLLSIFFFIQGKIRADLVALCAMLTLLITGVLDTSEALSGFSNNVVIMMAGLFIVGAGIFRTGLAKKISAKLIGLAGDSEDKLFVLVMIVTGVIGAFVSNTGTVAVMMPIVMSMVASSNLNPKRYLMPMAFASSMGLFTLISTPPNLVVNQALITNGFPSLSFFSFAPVGLIALSIGVVVLFFSSKWFLSDKGEAVKKKGASKTLAQLAEDYNLQQSSYALFVPADSALVGKTLSELQIRNRYNISVSKIVFMSKTKLLGRKVEEMLAGPDTIIMGNATLYCLGEKANMDSFAADNHLTYDSNDRLNSTSYQEDGIAEAYILPNSSLVNKTIIDCKFRETYDVNVIGIKRDTDYKMTHLETYRLKEGDALLVQGTWDHISSLEDRFEDLVVVGKPLAEASKITLDQKAPVTAIIMILMIIAMVSNVVPPVAAVLLACVAIIMTGCLKNMEEAYGSINWSSIVLIAAMLPMSIAFEKTGITVGIADMLSHYFGGSKLMLLAGIYVSTSILTIFISNTATAVLFAPIAMKAAIVMGVSPVPFMFAVAVAASMCFASPFSTSPNALVMHAGGYRFVDYIKVGLPLQIIMAIVMILVLPLIYPF